MSIAGGMNEIHDLVSRKKSYTLQARTLLSVTASAYSRTFNQKQQQREEEEN